MSQLELPVRRFLEDFCARAFPNRDFSRGSAVNDLLIKPMAAMMQPLRHEIDVAKLGLSVQNYLYLSTDQMDSLAANWGYFRQTGAQAFGEITLYFRQASTYEYSALEFLSDDGVSFVLQAPVTITAAQLLSNVQPDGTYAANVPVVSVGKGSRYTLAAGSINTIRNKPAAIVRVTNLVDFATTAPDESNYDVVNGMYRTLGLKNLVSRQSIRAPLFETFPGLLSVVVAGAGHSKMVRDLVSVPGGADIHVGGCVDVWLNTRTLTTDSVTLSYLPSTGKVRLVSADQALTDEAAFAFTACAVSAEGRVIPTQLVDTLDESVGFVFDNGGLAYETFVGRATSRGAALLATALKTRGYLIVPPAVASSPVVMDLRGPSFLSANVAAGDTISRGDNIQRVSHVSGRAAVLGPVTTGTAANSLPSSAITSGAAARGDLSVAVSGTANVQQLDRMVVTGCPGAGWYRVITVSGSTVTVGNLIANGTLVADATVLTLPAVPAGASRYRFSSTVQIPAVLDAGMPHLSLSSDGLTPPDPAYRVLAIYRTSTDVYLDIPNGSNPANWLASTAVSLLQGLRGEVPIGVPVFFERDEAAELPRSLPSTMSPADHPTLFASETPVDLAIGATSVTAHTFNQCGIACGDLIVWDISTETFDQALQPAAGGVGPIYTSFVDYITDSTIVFTPALPVEIPAGTSFAVIRNQTPLGTATLSSVSGSDVTLSAVPAGAGTLLGAALRDTVGVANTITAYSNGIATFSSSAGLRVGAIVESAPDTWRLMTYTTTSGHQGMLERVSGSNPVPIGAVTINTTRVIPITESPLGSVVALRFKPPRSSRAITLSASNYVSPTPFDINRPVYQTIAGVTHVGVLVAYDSVSRVWTIIPNDPAVDTFTVSATPGEELIVSGGTGSGRISAIAALADYGYVAPSAPDVGDTVRQGPYSGTLYNVGSFNGSPSYTWYILPDSPADLFDRLDLPVWVDQDGDGVQDGAEPFGYLAAPASRPLYTGVAPAIGLYEACPWSAATQVDIISRFGTGGATFTGGQLVATVSNAAFSGLTDATVVVPLGPAVGDYAVQAASATTPALTLDTAIEPIDVLPTGALAYSSVFPTTVAAGTSVNVNVPNTTIGEYGHPGRVLRLRYGATTYRLRITGRVSATSVTVETLPIALSASVPIDVAVVEGYVTPYFVVANERKYDYRCFAPPTIGTNLPLAGTGSVNGSVLTDPSQDFSSVAERSDGLQLYIESSDYASTTPYRVTAQSTTTLTVSGAPFTSATNDVAYRVDYRPLFDEIARAGTISGTVVSFPSAHGLTLVRRLHVLVNGVVRRVVGTSTTTITLNAAIGGLDDEARVTVFPLVTDRTAYYSVAGTAFYTYNYYAGNYMQLPVARLVSVQELDPDTLAPVRDLTYSLSVVRKGFRYSPREVNDLVISEEDARGRPLRITYITDPTIRQADDYLNRDDTTVVGSSLLAKRAESLVVDAAVTVRSRKTAAELQTIISQYIETLDSSVRLSKAGIVKHLYDIDAVSYIDVSQFTLSGLYYQDDGTLVAYADTPELFGAETACYLAGSVVVTKVDV